MSLRMEQECTEVHSLGHSPMWGEGETTRSASVNSEDGRPWTTLIAPWSPSARHDNVLILPQVARPAQLARLDPDASARGKRATHMAMQPPAAPATACTDESLIPTMLGLSGVRTRVVDSGSCERGSRWR